MTERGITVEGFALMDPESQLERPSAGQLIRAARKRRGWTQQQLADIVGTSRTHLIRWEKNRSYPNDEHRVKLAAVLGLDPEHLIRPDVGEEDLRSFDERLRAVERALDELRIRLRSF